MKIFEENQTNSKKDDVFDIPEHNIEETNVSNLFGNKTEELSFVEQLWKDHKEAIHQKHPELNLEKLKKIFDLRGEKGITELIKSCY